MSVLTNLLSKIAKDKGDDIAVDALSSNELRNRAMNAIVDNIQGGKLNNTANAVLDNVPIMTRSEGVSNMGVMIQRGNTPKYDNVAVGSINSVPLFFGEGNQVKAHIIDPDIANTGRGAFARMDTGWQPYSYIRNHAGATPADAQREMFVGEFGATPIANRQQLRDRVWNPDFLSNTVDDGMWGEFNAPFTNNDLLHSSRTVDRSIYPLREQVATLRNDLRNAIVDDVTAGTDREDMLRRLGRYLPVGIATVGTLTGLMGGGNESA